MPHKFQVIEAGAVIWEEQFDDDASTNFSADHLNRPDDADPYPPARMLVIDGQIIGMQICQAEEDHIATLVDHEFRAANAARGENLGAGAAVDAHVDAQLTVALAGLGLEVFNEGAN